MKGGLDYLLDVLLPLPPPLGLPVVEGHPAPLGLLEGCPRPIAISFHKFAMTLQTLQGGF